jgi:cytochrome c-type biogenesis protein CcmH
VRKFIAWGFILALAAALVPRVNLLGLALVPSAGAVEPGEMLADPALEARAEAIGEKLRCLVCQNETIEDSGADLAHDLRVLLRQRLSAGDTDRQAIQFIVDRYGDFVLLKPPVEPATYLLWGTPFLALALGGLGIFLYLRRRAPMPEPPLSESEQKRLAEILKEGEG